MHARQWLLGLVGVGAGVGFAMAAGCGSSSSSGPSADGGSDSGDDADGACMPEMAIVPDSGPCNVCLTGMCASAIAACNTDCTCGGAVNTVAKCLAALPPPSPEAGAGATGLLGAAAPLVQCLISSGMGGTALGGAGGGLGALLGGGSGGGGGGGASAATTGYISCLGTSCAAECLGVGDAGTDGAALADSGAPETGSQPEGGADGGEADAPPDAASEASAADGPSEGAVDASDAGLQAETSDN